MPGKPIRFSELLRVHIDSIVKKQFIDKKIDGSALTPVLTELRDTIRSSINDVFSKSKHRLAPDAMNWVANQYFKAVQINGMSVNDMVVINDYDLKTMSLTDIKLMRDLFNETAMSVQLNEEYDRRNVS